MILTISEHHFAESTPVDLVYIVKYNSAIFFIDRGSNAGIIGAAYLAFLALEEHSALEETKNKKAKIN
jgi:hypothetical protein